MAVMGNIVGEVEGQQDGRQQLATSGYPEVSQVIVDRCRGL